MTKVLFVTSEFYPLIKTGGLADVSSSLPAALSHLGLDIIPVLPGYPAVMEGLQAPKQLKVFTPAETPYATTLYEACVAPSGQKIWVVDTPELFNRDGGPYVDSNKQDWPDNCLRFGHFCDIVSRLSLGQCGLSWVPDLVHGNDWQGGLVFAHLHHYAHLHPQKKRPATLITIHNIAYQGLFSYAEFEALSLPHEWWASGGVEFHGHFSFLKAGINYADVITTVSPHYAQEILSPEQGYGFEGLLNHRKEHLIGILNGADYAQWNPKTDAYIPHQYGPTSLQQKNLNKVALQQSTGLASNKKLPLIGIVSRLAYQKGMDFLRTMIERFIEDDVQWVVLGSGDPHIEQELLALSRLHPEKCQVRIGYDENMAHHIEAAADIFFMPSRYEPCGLNQIYSLKYGTIPVTTKTGGLADTIIDADDANLAAGTATGFLADNDHIDVLEMRLRQALLAFQNKPLWLKLRRTAMAQDFSWNNSARQYLSAYNQAQTLNQKKALEFSS